MGYTTSLCKSGQGRIGRIQIETVQFKQTASLQNLPLEDPSSDLRKSSQVPCVKPDAKATWIGWSWIRHTQMLSEFTESFSAIPQKSGNRGFLKLWYPQMIHVRLGSSLINNPAIGYPIYGTPQITDNYLSSEWSNLRLDTHRTKWMIFMVEGGLDSKSITPWHFVTSSLSKYMKVNCLFNGVNPGYMKAWVDELLMVPLTLTIEIISFFLDIPVNQLAFY